MSDFPCCDSPGGVPVTASLEDRTKKAAEAMADADLEGDGVPSYETLAADALAAAGVPALREALTEARAEIDDWETDYHEVDGRLQAAEAALVGARADIERISGAWAEVIQREQLTKNAHAYDLVGARKAALEEAADPAKEWTLTELTLSAEEREAIESTPQQPWPVGPDPAVTEAADPRIEAVARRRLFDEFGSAAEGWEPFAFDAEMLLAAADAVDPLRAVLDAETPGAVS